MTKKDFRLIADVLSDFAGPAQLTKGKVDHDDLIKAFADRLRSTNPRFDRERFITACKEGI